MLRAIFCVALLACLVSHGHAGGAGVEKLEQGSPREAERKTETAQPGNQGRETDQSAPPPAANGPFAPIINVYTKKHTDEPSHCTEPKNWKEWGSFSWCRSLEWLDSERIIAVFTVVLAIATGVLGFATWRLWKATDKLWEAGERQITLTRETFAKRERPYVFIFGVRDIEPGPNENFDGYVPYTVANHGQAPAQIDRIEYSLAPDTKPSETGAAWNDHPLVVAPILGISDQTRCEANSVKWIDSGGRVLNVQPGREKSAVIPEIKVEGTTWFFRAMIFYRGPFSEGHETSGCWKYDRETCQFVQYGGKEYNYTK